MALTSFPAGTQVPRVLGPGLPGPHGSDTQCRSASDNKPAQRPPSPQPEHGKPRTPPGCRPPRPFLPPPAADAGGDPGIPGPEAGGGGCGQRHRHCGDLRRGASRSVDVHVLPAEAGVEGLFYRQRDAMSPPGQGRAGQPLGPREGRGQACLLSPLQLAQAAAAPSGVSLPCHWTSSLSWRPAWGTGWWVLHGPLSPHLTPHFCQRPLHLTQGHAPSEGPPGLTWTPPRCHVQPGAPVTHPDGSPPPVFSSSHPTVPPPPACKNLPPPPSHLTAHLHKHRPRTQEPPTCTSSAHMHKNRWRCRTSQRPRITCCAAALPDQWPPPPSSPSCARGPQGSPQACAFSPRLRLARSARD